MIAGAPHAGCLIAHAFCAREVGFLPTTFAVAMVQTQSQLKRKEGIYRKLLIKITSLLPLPFDSSSCLPSRDQLKSKMRPEANLVTW